MDKVDVWVHNLEERMNKGNEELENRVIGIINEVNTPPPQLQADKFILDGFARAPAMPASVQGAAQSLSQAGRRETQYDQCRRSLRVFPVKGGDLQLALKKYMHDFLDLTDEFVEEMDSVMVRWHRDPRSKADHEVIVTFETKEVRDAVKAASKNLAGSTIKAGIRLHIPGYLSTNFKLLENLGYQTKSVAGVQRVIKFDDDNQDVMMDVKIGEHWKRIRPAEALAAKRSKTFTAPSGPEEMDSSNIADFFSASIQLQ